MLGRCAVVLGVDDGMELSEDLKGLALATSRTALRNRLFRLALLSTPNPSPLPRTGHRAPGLYHPGLPPGGGALSPVPGRN
jgi:hypothetical protein